MRKVKRVSDNSDELNLKNEIVAIILLFISIFLIFSLISFNPEDPSFFKNSFRDNIIRNYSGRIGAEVSAILFVVFGYSSYIIFFYQLKCFLRKFYFIF